MPIYLPTFPLFCFKVVKPIFFAVLFSVLWDHSYITYSHIEAFLTPPHSLRNYVLCTENQNIHIKLGQ